MPSVTRAHSAPDFVPASTPTSGRGLPQTAASPANSKRWFQKPLVLLAVIAALAACVVQSGELGSSDTQHRLQAAQSFWTSEPAVFKDEYPEFGIHGRNGKLYGWYGVGQSVLMLPAAVVGTYVQRLPIFHEYNG